MLPLFLLPLGFYVLSRGKTRRYSKPVNSNTGLILCPNKIEIVNQRIALSTIDGLIVAAKKYYGKSILVLEAFENVLEKLSPILYKKYKIRSFSEKEKMILGILFILVYNRFFSVVDCGIDYNEFENKFMNKEYQIVKFNLKFSDEEEHKLDRIYNEFEIRFSY